MHFVLTIVYPKKFLQGRLSAIDLFFVSSFKKREVNFDISDSSVHWKTALD